MYRSVLTKKRAEVMWQKAFFVDPVDCVVCDIAVCKAFVLFY